MDIPKKFQNEDGTLNNDALLKSYSELEKKIGAMVSVPGACADVQARERFNRAVGVPETIAEYPEHPMFDIGDDVRQRFLDAGLNKTQVEKIYDIASEYLAPAFAEVFQSQYENDSLAELCNFFGGDEKMTAAMADIEKFGEKFLPSDTFESLSSSVAGIKSIHNMMQTIEPKVHAGAKHAETLTERSLREMMKDPKYWRDHDAEHIRKIESGFKKLYS
ncbi:MAG: hypothetical protein FWE17_00650 [Alphaproteobacteria bacterium]|nr:hypothetical protein [Alphaproteobacteria bacterium]